MNRQTFLDLCTANMGKDYDFGHVSDITGQWNGDDGLTIRLGDLPLDAIAYFFQMGVKQASGDVKAARGAFLGKGAGAWSVKDRTDAAKELGVTMYNDMVE